MGYSPWRRKELDTAEQLTLTSYLRMFSDMLRITWDYIWNLRAIPYPSIFSTGYFLRVNLIKMGSALHRKCLRFYSLTKVRSPKARVLCSFQFSTLQSQK